MKNGMALVIVALSAIVLFLWSKVEGFTPTAQAAFAGSLSPSTAPAPTGWLLISEVPPPDVRRYPLGGTTYANFTQPIALGDTGYYQWGVTAEGMPVVSAEPPETYASWEWI